jgi:hypothetical protein
MLNCLKGEINIEIGPVEMAWMRFLQIKDMFDGGILKPWKRFVGQKILVVIAKQPDAIGRNVANLGF